MPIKKPKKDEYAPFYQSYIQQLPPKGALLPLLRQSFKSLSAQLINLPDNAGNLRYAEHKWTIKDMLVHLIDAERVFAFRALWFIRADRAPLPGFNQEFWMEQADTSNRSIKDLLKEWKSVRENTIALAQQCTEKQSLFLGTASNRMASTRAMFWIILGHQLHHEQILKIHYYPLLTAVAHTD
jgi:uncharacterized damage-inducible protein DinB